METQAFEPHLNVDDLAPNADGLEDDSDESDDLAANVDDLGFFELE